jgi:acetyltransferase-like isoleucine patch superfamily enzyme
MKKSLVRRIANRILGMMARVAPGATTLRPMLHRLRGVTIRGKVFIGDDVYLENEYPEAIELEDGAQICVRSLLLAHTHGVGRIVIAKDAFLGAHCVVTAQVGQTLRIGEGAVIAASCVVSSDVPDHALIGQPKAVALAKVTVPLKMETSYEDFLLGLRPWK